MPNKTTEGWRFDDALVVGIAGNVQLEMAMNFLPALLAFKLLAQWCGVVWELCDETKSEEVGGGGGPATGLSAPSQPASYLERGLLLALCVARATRKTGALE